MGFPVAWPCVRHGPITSGGVFLGSGSLELIRIPRIARLMGQRPAVGGIALVSTTAGRAATNLAAAAGFALRRTRRITRVMERESRQVSWVGAYLSRWPGDVVPYPCDYDHDPASQRAIWLARSHQSAVGGPPASRLSSVTIRTQALDDQVRAWTRLLGPPDQPGRWTFPDGVPQLVLAASECEELQLDLGVTDAAAILGLAHENGFAVRGKDARHAAMPGAVLRFIDAP